MTLSTPRNEPSPGPSPGPGTVLAERYRLVQRLGVGGMAEVFEAEHLVTRRRLAVKLLRRDAASDRASVDRFYREASVSAGIDSEHIVEIVDCDVDRATGTPFMVMELLQGEDLARYIPRTFAAGAPVPSSLALSILRQVASALDKVHAQGIVHRDLKPANLILTFPSDQAPRVKILDFGIATLTSDDPSAGSDRLGTPLYMAPEQLAGDAPITAAVDIWALTLIAFELFVGVAYWEGNTAASLYVRIPDAKARPKPSELAAKRRVTLPAAFDAWFLRGVDPDPARRPETAGALVGALLRVFDPQATQPPTSSSVAPAAPSPSARPSLRRVPRSAAESKPPVKTGSPIPPPRTTPVVPAVAAAPVVATPVVAAPVVATPVVATPVVATPVVATPAVPEAPAVPELLDAEPDDDDLVAPVVPPAAPVPVVDVAAVEDQVSTREMPLPPGARPGRQIVTRVRPVSTTAPTTRMKAAEPAPAPAPVPMVASRVASVAAPVEPEDLDEVDEVAPVDHEPEILATSAPQPDPLAFVKTTRMAPVPARPPPVESARPSPPPSPPVRPSLTPAAPTKSPVYAQVAELSAPHASIADDDDALDDAAPAVMVPPSAKEVPRIPAPAVDSLSANIEAAMQGVPPRRGRRIPRALEMAPTSLLPVIPQERSRRPMGLLIAATAGTVLLAGAAVYSLVRMRAPTVTITSVEDPRWQRWNLDEQRELERAVSTGATSLLGHVQTGGFGAEGAPDGLDTGRSLAALLAAHRAGVSMPSDAQIRLLLALDRYHLQQGWSSRTVDGRATEPTATATAWAMLAYDHMAAITRAPTAVTRVMVARDALVAMQRPDGSFSERVDGRFDVDASLLAVWALTSRDAPNDAATRNAVGWLRGVLQSPPLGWTTRPERQDLAFWLFWTARERIGDNPVTDEGVALRYVADVMSRCGAGCPTRAWAMLASAALLKRPPSSLAPDTLTQLSTWLRESARSSGASRDAATGDLDALATKTLLAAELLRLGQE